MMTMPPDTTSGAVSADARGGVASGPLAAPGALPAQPPPAAPNASASWYDGIPTETLGWLQNKGVELANPKDALIRIADQYRSAERYIGVPADQLLRIPQPNASEADRRAFLTRLGVPSTAAEYDLSTVKFSDGTDLDADFVAVIQEAAAAANMSKDKIADFTTKLIRFDERRETSYRASNDLRIQEQKALMERNWGVNKDFNLLQAMAGARRLGITDEMVNALREEPRWGEYNTLEFFRRIGAATTEDTFVEGAQATGAPTTLPGAQAELNRLLADDAWGRRLTTGDVEARRQFEALTQQITGVNPAMEAAP
jgi:hypothetical protein